MKKNWKKKAAGRREVEVGFGRREGCSCYLCEHPEIADPVAWTRDRIAADVRTMGWSVVGVLGDRNEPPWAYTIGLWQSYQMPELVVCGIDLEDACKWLNDLASRMRDGESLYADTPTYGICGPPQRLLLRQVHDDWMSDLLAQIPLYYGDRVPVEQVVWSDHDGRFPGQSGFERRLRNKQPMLWLPKHEHPVNVWRGHGLPARG
jgi:hypothetical protein